MAQESIQQIEEEKTYPYIEHLNKGLKVWTSERATLPGYFLSYHAAEKAIAKYEAKVRQAARQREEKKQITKKKK